MEKNAKIYVAGHNGLVGSAIVRCLISYGYNNLVVRNSKDLDLTNQIQVNTFFKKVRPDYVFLCAGKVGGILANSTYPADFIYKNIMISTNVIHASYEYNVKKLLNMGSSCIYPRLAPQPMKEESLLSGTLESTNEGYALAKIAAIKLCSCYNRQYGTNFISVMPTNQYGINDNFNMETAHLLPMIIRRLHLAKLLAENDFNTIRKDLQRYPLGWGLDGTFSFDDDNALKSVLNKVGAFRNHVVMWGDGSVYREFMNSDDLADACIYLIRNKNASEIGEFVNITWGKDIRLGELFDMVKNIVGFHGGIKYDTSKPNGMPRKVMDAKRINFLGWQPNIPLNNGISNFYNWYKNL